MRKLQCIMIISMKNYSDQVRRAINQCGMSRYAISKASGVSQGMLSRFVAGEMDMTLRTLGRIAPFIGVDITVVKRTKYKKPSRKG